MIIEKDTIEQILRLRGLVLSGTGAAGLMAAWEDAYADFPELTAKCKSEYKDNLCEGETFESALAPYILNSLTDGFPKLQEAYANYKKSLVAIGKSYASTFGLTENVACYFYVGLCNGAGWATSISGMRAVLLGAEKIVELGWHTENKLRDLIYHELCHVAHEIIRGEDLDGIDNSFKSNSGGAVWHLYMEGFAQHFAQVLNGGAVIEQHGREWLDWCNNNHPETCREYFRRIESGEPVNDFFGDWSRYRGHGDVGYYLGYRFTEHLNETMTAKEIALMPFEEIESRLLNYLNNY